MNFLIVCLYATLILGLSFMVSFLKKKPSYQILMALSSGALLSLCFLEFLPHAFEEGKPKSVSFFVLLGVLIQGLADVYLLPRLGFLDKWLKAEGSHHSHSHSLSSGSVCSLAGCLAICSFFDGIRLLSALEMDVKVAITTFLALFLHLFSEAAVIAGLVISSNMKKKALFSFILSFCVALILGAGVAEIFSNLSSSSLMAFATGILMYICFVHLVPFSLKGNKQKWLFAGMILIFALSFLA